MGFILGSFQLKVVRQGVNSFRLPSVAGLCEEKKNKNLSYLFKLNFKV
jgi:hypothetical protein